MSSSAFRAEFRERRGRDHGAWGRQAQPGEGSRVSRARGVERLPGGQGDGRPAEQILSRDGGVSDQEGSDRPDVGSGSLPRTSPFAETAHRAIRGCPRPGQQAPAAPRTRTSAGAGPRRLRAPQDGESVQAVGRASQARLRPRRGARLREPLLVVRPHAQNLDAANQLDQRFRLRSQSGLTQLLRILEGGLGERDVPRPGGHHFTVRDIFESGSRAALRRDVRILGTERR